MKAFVLPHTAMAGAVSRFGSDAVKRVHDMRPDIIGLSQVLRGAPALRVSGYVYDADAIHWAVRDLIQEAPLRSLLAMCQAVNPDVDEIRLARSAVARSFGKVLKLRHLTDHDVDPAALREHVLETLFYRKVVRTLDGFEVIYLDNRTATTEKLKTATRAERIKKLPNKTPTGPTDPAAYAERWLLGLADKSQISHLAVPVVQWRQRVSADKRIRPEPRLEYGGAYETYDAASNTMLHFSPLLGAVMLAGSLGQDAVVVSLNRMFTRNPRNARSKPLPHRAAGAMPGLVAAAAVERLLIWSPRFTALSIPTRQLLPSQPSASKSRR